MTLSPEIFETVSELREELATYRQRGDSIGFVPTMGYLHDGHSALIERAAAECDVVVVSIFVNPLQFAPDEDLAAYPRDFERDLERCSAAGSTLVFHPSVEEMYPSPTRTMVHVAELSSEFEGASRPTHFSGVATVVAKLFSIVGPCRAYFGEKDFQQLVVVKSMVADLSMPIEVVGCDIVREPDGLAKSSRNVYLSEAERQAATVLRRALSAGEELILSGERDVALVESAMSDIVTAEPLAALDYVAVVDATDLHRVSSLPRETRLLVAAKVGRPRLLDNVGVTVIPVDLRETGADLAT